MKLGANLTVLVVMTK